MDHKGDLLDIIYWLSKHCRFNHKKYPEKFRRPKDIQNGDADKKENIRQETNEVPNVTMKKVKPKQEKFRINQLRKENKIRSSGSDIPTVIENFEQLSATYEVDGQLIKNLGEQGYTNPTPIQMQVWPLMFSDRELLATSPTGSGKTAGFILPVLHKLGKHDETGIRAVILAPTRELARQTYSECLLLAEDTGIEVCLLNEVRNAQNKFNSDSTNNYDILITSPNSLVYLINKEEPINLSQVHWLVIDESDRLFEDGKMGFRDQIAVIYKACNSEKVRRALFSATVAPDVQEWCKLTLDNVAIVTVGARNTPCKDVNQKLVYCGENDDDMYAKTLAVNEIFRDGYDVPCIIFVNTKERAQQLFWELIPDRNVVAIHSDIPKRARDNLIKSFRKGEIFILICTDLISRGLDFQGVNLVVNFDFPHDNSSYIHRIGRTGRAGHKGKAVTFWCKKDIPKLKGIATIMHQSGSEVADFILNMKKRSKNKWRKQKPEKSGEKVKNNNTTTTKQKAGEVNTKMNTAGEKSKNKKNNTNGEPSKKKNKKRKRTESDDTQNKRLKEQNI